MDARAEKQKREQASYHFELQAARLGFSVLARMTNYRYLVRDETRGVELTAIVLAESFDFYIYRLNKMKHRIDLVIAQQHNAALPIRCVSMSESREYGPGTPPATPERANKQRRNQDEVRLFVSLLLVGSKAAAAELAAMPLRTRQRYLSKRDEYLRPKVGRPWAS